MKETSKLAYEEIQPHISGLHKKIYSGFLKIKKGTFREIAKASSLRDEQVWKRLSEMSKKGLIKDTGEIKICNVSKRPCGIWEIVN